MIYLYTGTPGSGKSYHVAKDIYFYISHGKNVISNFEFRYDLILSRSKSKKPGYLFERDNYDLTVDWLMDFARLCHLRDQLGRVLENQTWIVIDEAQLLFNCRCWNERERQKWCYFFTQHRKLGYNVILITQYDRMIDRQIRSLVEYEVKHRKLNNFGLFGLIVTLFAFGHPIFGAFERWYGVAEKTGKTMMIGKKKYYELYDSYKMFDTQAG